MKFTQPTVSNHTPRRGKFIVLEGINTSGKTVQQKALKWRMKSYGIDVMELNEPTHENPIGYTLRNKYLNGRRKADKNLLVHLYALDRYDQMWNPDNGTRFWLANGVNIIQSRNYLSSVAMLSDSENNDESMEWICQVNEMSTKLLKPDVIIYIDVDPEEAIKRQHERDLFDIFEDDDKIRYSHQQYAKAIEFVRKRNNENIVIVNGNQAQRDVEENIWKIVHPLLK